MSPPPKVAEDANDRVATVWILRCDDDKGRKSEDVSSEFLVSPTIKQPPDADNTFFFFTVVVVVVDDDAEAENPRAPITTKDDFQDEDGEEDEDEPERDPE